MITCNQGISDKDVFKQMFKSFKANGIYAEQNFACCQSCGWTEMEDLYDLKDDSDVIFYHQQDNDSFDENGNLTKTLYLSWNGDGNKIKEIIEMFGYIVNWNGSEHKRIGIIKPSE